MAGPFGAADNAGGPGRAQLEELEEELEKELKGEFTVIVKDHRQVTPEPASEAPGVTVRRVISEKDGAPNFTMRVFDVEPGASSPFHTHSWEHEVFILAGQGRLRSKDGETPFREGDVVFVAPEEKHQFINSGDTDLRFICVVPL